MIRNSLILFSLIAIVASCNLFRKNQKPDNAIDYNTSLPAPEYMEYKQEWTGNNEILYSNYQSSATRYWDLEHTEINIHFNFEERSTYGFARLILHPHFYPTDSLILDAKGMEIKDVLLIDSPWTEVKSKQKYSSPKWVYSDSSKLRIYFSNTFNRNQKVQIEVHYAAYPYKGELKGSSAIAGDRGLYFINHDLKSPYKPRQIWTQGETESNSQWFPTLDAPNQKTTLKISMFVPDTMVTLSNGILTQSIKSTTPGIRMDVWEQKLPHAPYLTMMAVGNWALIKDNWRGKPVNYLVEKKFEPYAKMIFGNTPAMMEFFSKYLGVDYPWDKYSQVVVRDFVSGAMENTSATVHMEQLQHTPREHADETYEDYISHELFHQWFGNLVTTESWSNITLNESFATYGEYLWREHFYGKDNAESLLAELRDQYKSYGVDEEKHLVRYQYQDPGELFDNISYQKGACILHMLRHTIGEQAFRDGLKLYLSNNKFKTAEVADLRLAFEEITGQDLNWFFNQWYFDWGHPEIYLSLESVKSGNWKLKIDQTTSHRNTFVFPVKIKYSVNGIKYEKIHFANERTSYVDLGKIKPDWYVFDADNSLLCDENISAGDYTESISQIRMMNSAWEYATDGNRLRLLEMAARLVQGEKGGRISELFKPEVKRIYYKALKSGNDLIISRAIEFAGGNPEFELISSGRQGMPLDSNLWRVANNKSLKAETRKTALMNLIFKGLKTENLLLFANDSSLSVANFVISRVTDQKIWVPYALETGINNPNSILASNWAKKLIIHQQGNLALVLATLGNHKFLDPEHYIIPINALFYYVPRDVQVATLNDLIQALHKSGKTGLLNLIILRLETELERIQNEIDQMDDYDPDMFKELTDLKISFGKLIERYKARN